MKKLESNSRVTDLKKVLSASAYSNVENALDTGVTGISMLGYSGYDYDIHDIIERMQALADAKHLEHNTPNYGDGNSNTPYVFNNGVGNYFKENRNAFALKTRKFQMGKLKFPLVGDYKSQNKSYLTDCEVENYEDIFNRFANGFNVVIEDINAKKMVTEKKGLVRAFLENSKGIVKTAGRNVKHKISKKPMEIDYKSLPIAYSKGGLGKAKVKLAKISRQKFNFKPVAMPISDADKIVALADHFNGRTINILDKQYKEKTMFYLTPDREKFKFISKVLADIFVCQAIDMGAEANEKVEHSLKLQLTNALATLSSEDSKYLPVISKNAERAARIVMHQLKISPMKIVENKQKMGITYVNKPQTLYDVFFGETLSDKFMSVDRGNEKVILYTDHAKVFKEAEQTFGEILGQTHEPIQTIPDEDLFEDPTPEVQPDPTPDVQPDPTQPKVEKVNENPYFDKPMILTQNAKKLQEQIRKRKREFVRVPSDRPQPIVIEETITPTQYPEVMIERKSKRTQYPEVVIERKPKPAEQPKPAPERPSPNRKPGFTNRPNAGKYQRKTVYTPKIKQKKVVQQKEVTSEKETKQANSQVVINVYNLIQEGDTYNYDNRIYNPDNRSIVNNDNRVFNSDNRSIHNTVNNFGTPSENKPSEDKKENPQLVEKNPGYQPEPTPVKDVKPVEKPTPVEEDKPVEEVTPIEEPTPDVPAGKGEKKNAFNDKTLISRRQVENAFNNILTKAVQGIHNNLVEKKLANDNPEYDAQVEIVEYLQTKLTGSEHELDKLSDYGKAGAKFYDAMQTFRNSIVNEIFGEAEYVNKLDVGAASASALLNNYFKEQSGTKSYLKTFIKQNIETLTTNLQKQQQNEKGK